jgi:hypothetical protein
VSDNSRNNFLSGDFTGRSHSERHGEEKYALYPRRPLVEEYVNFSLSDLRNNLPRQELISLGEQGRPVRMKFGGRSFEISLCAEPFQLTWRPRQVVDAIRVWLLCGCGRRTRRLYMNPQKSGIPSVLACRSCHQLRYLSQNSGGTRWFNRIAKPLRKLVRRQEKLLLRKHTQRVREELDFINGQIFILTQRAKPKRRTRIPFGGRRPYKNVRLVLGLGQVDAQ